MSMIKTALLLAAMTGLFLFVGELMGGEQGAIGALLLAAVMNFVAYFWSDKIALASYGAQEVSREQAPALFEIVERLASKANIPMPRLYVIPDAALNAFATGRNPAHAAVAATEGILNALNPEELEGVLAHELSHVLNRDILISSVAATLAGAIGLLGRLAYWIPMGGRDEEDRRGNPVAALLMLILAPVAAFLIQMAVSRSREYGADSSGARLVGHSMGLVSALRKLQGSVQQVPLKGADPSTAHLFIVNPLAGRSLFSLLSTHPPIENRIARLLAMDR